MSHEFLLRLAFGAAAVIITDLVLFFGLRRLFVKQGGKSPAAKRYAWIYLSIIALFLIYAMLHFLYLHFYGWGSWAYRQYFFIAGCFLLLYLPKLVMLIFVIAGNLILLLLQLISYIVQGKGHYDFVRRIRRIKFFSWIGFIAGLLLFGYILYGMFVLRTAYKVKNVEVAFHDLPASFDGTRVLLIADAHLGSFFNEKDLLPAIRLIRDEHPDMIVFAGDMINVSADETQDYISLFDELKAPLGKYAVFGNHDEDDYMKMTAGPDRITNEYKLEQEERRMGFDLLRNQHVFIKKGNDSIAIMGIDSWGLPPFHAFGNLKKAMEGVPQQSFKILISHIPNHWEKEVKGKTNIDLTLAGHTHAAQIGIDEPWLHWSPIALKYPLYMGLYQNGSQYLYINAGLGYLSFPGRIGIPPEITVITLKRK